MVASLVRNEGPEGREAGFLARNWGRVGTWYGLCVLLGSVRELDLDHTEMDVGEGGDKNTFFFFFVIRSHCSPG